MRQIIHLNHNWTFNDDFKEEFLSNDIIDGLKVDIPHTNFELPLNYFDENDSCFICTYQKRVFIKEEFKNKNLILNFEGVMAYAEVYINGRFAIAHKGGYLPFNIDIAPFANYNSDNLITVIVNSNEISDIPPFGHVIDYLTYGGIYREVNLTILNLEHINNVKVTPYDANKIVFEVDATFNEKKQYTIIASILDSAKMVLKKETYKNIDLTSLKFTMSNIVASYWDLENPTLYGLNLELFEKDNLLDTYTCRFGFRKAEFKKDGFYLNDKKIKLIGLNRHQSYPYVGYAMPKRVQKMDAKILKEELGVNIVRTSHYPQSQHFLEACDELGLLVFEEIPGWQHVSDKPSFHEVVKQNVKDMINRDYNHPSIILWGVRINESKDVDELYRQTNAIAHAIDKTRMTGGVRNFAKSSFLEDVYTYNDFVFNGGETILFDPSKIAFKDAPYLVSEYMGHMYPTKKYDNEERRSTHALRHLKVINEMMGNERISGAIGWCMNDYNTHQEFGSGDRICHHGVNDIFRLPKSAFYTYASQSDNKPILYPLSFHNAGEYDESSIKKVYVLTNCDYVELYKNDAFVTRLYPMKKEFPNLKHPPILVSDFIGDMINQEEERFGKDINDLKVLLNAINEYGPNNLPLKIKILALKLLKKHKLSIKDIEDLYTKYQISWGEKNASFEYIGYIKGREVKRVKIGKSIFSRVEVKADDYELNEDITYDATRIVIKYLDQDDNVLPYAFDPILISIDGPLKLIGPNNICLTAGTAAFYVKTINKSGVATISVGNDRFVKEVKINVTAKEDEVKTEKRNTSRYTTIFKSPK